MNPSPRRPRLTGTHFLLLRSMPRDGRPAGVDFGGTRGQGERWLADLAAYGFVAEWRGRGWAITDAGIAALDATDAGKRVPVRRRRMSM